MKNIEQTIVELGSIFQQLAHMVKEQEEVVQRWVSPGNLLTCVLPELVTGGLIVCQYGKSSMHWHD